jgi:pimeloyl-ACP methyl ester carboxylesterase
MLKKLIFLCLSITFAFSVQAEEGIAEANGIEIWYETFGSKEDPALLLIMGGCCQGIMWPTELCQQFADEGFYVIRYDHRDSGYSTCFDFEKNPYDLSDMAVDAIGLLDYLEIEQAHLCGLSMGGPIAELMSVIYPEKIQTITLMATSCEFRPLLLAFFGLPPEEGALSSPLKVYTDWMKEFLDAPPKNDEEKLEQRLMGWRILNGTVVPFEAERYREIHREFLTRALHPESIGNHVPAIKKSEALVREIPSQVKVPTLIFHGSEDPILPPDHGQALANSIASSKYVFIEGMGHVPNCHFYKLWIKAIKQHALKR